MVQTIGDTTLVLPPSSDLPCCWPLCQAVKAVREQVPCRSTSGRSLNRVIVIMGRPAAEGRWRPWTVLVHASDQVVSGTVGPPTTCATGIDITSFGSAREITDYTAADIQPMVRLAVASYQ